MESQQKISLNDIPLVDIVRRYTKMYPAPVPGIILDIERSPDVDGIYTIYTYADQTRDLPTRKMHDFGLWLTNMKNFINSAISDGAVQLDERITPPNA